MRLQRFLARCGHGSRRSCEKLIEEGRVSINGTEISEMGARVKEGDVVRINGDVVEPRELKYFILNKPKGTISVNMDHKERTYVVDLIPEGRKMGLFPVGRLDLDTTGLLILTNDGELANRIAHPRYGVTKEYVALVKGVWTLRTLKEVTRDGVHLDDGYLVKNIDIVKAVNDGTRTRVTLRIKEGRKHVVKRIFLSLGGRVYELHRSAIGNLTLENIGTGEFESKTRDDLVKDIGID
jgi:23S rRNA pseudouridine2605 synthase